MLMTLRFLSRSRFRRSRSSDVGSNVVAVAAPKAIRSCPTSSFGPTVDPSFAPTLRFLSRRDKDAIDFKMLIKSNLNFITAYHGRNDTSTVARSSCARYCHLIIVLPLRVRIEESIDSFGVLVSSLTGRVLSNLLSVFDFFSDLSDVLLSTLFAAAPS